MTGGWDDQAEAYRISFAGVCAGTFPVLLQDVDGPRCRLLDVGSGTGAFARRAADRGVQVTAVDADPSMVAMTASALDDHGTVSYGRLPRLGLTTGAFDVTVANFVINHVADPREGVAELARTVRPGGAVLITTWTQRRTAQARLFDDAFTEVDAVRPAAITLPPEKDFERSVAGVSGLCEDAGLQVQEGRELRWEWRIGWDDLWTGVSAGIAGIGQTYLAQSPRTRDRFRAALRRGAEKLTNEGVIVLPSVAAYVRAVKPDRTANPVERFRGNV